MKRLYMLLVCSLFGMSVFAADVIVLRDNTRIDAKITEVSSSTIKYKRADNPDGPVFVQETNGIAVIMYENGTVKTYDNPAPAAKAAPAASNNKKQEAEAAEEEPADGKKIKFNPTPSDKFVVGLTAGYISKTVKSHNGSNTAKGSIMGRENKYTPAVRFGLTINPTFKYGIGIRTGAFLEYAREKGDMPTGKSSSSTTTMHDLTVSIPFQISYRYELIKKLSFMIYTGPVIDLGAYRTNVSGGHKDENYYSNGLSTYREKGFNALWGIGAGIQWSRLRLDIGGDFGMVKKNHEGNYYSLINKPFYITLTCML